MSDVRLSWYQRSSKYYDFINKSVDKLYRFQLSKEDPSQVIKSKSKSGQSIDATTQIKEVVIELVKVVPSFGITLSQLNALLDIVLDPDNGKLFTTSVKTQLISTFHKCVVLIDFSTFFRIISSFKLSSFANSASATTHTTKISTASRITTARGSTKALPRTIQVKLADTLLVNFANFKFDKRFLQVLPLVYNLISLGYIKKQIIHFVIQMLTMASEIDPHFKVAYFVNAYKLDLAIDLYISKEDVTLLPLLVVLIDQLRKLGTGDASNSSDDGMNGFKSPAFDNYYYDLMNIVKDQKLNNRTFDKIDEKTVNQLIKVKMAYVQYVSGNDSMTVQEAVELAGSSEDDDDDGENNDEIDNEILASKDLKTYRWNLQRYIQLMGYLKLLLIQHNIQVGSSPMKIDNNRGNHFATKRRKLEDGNISIGGEVDNDGDTSMTDSNHSIPFSKMNYTACLSLDYYFENIGQFTLPNQMGTLLSHFGEVVRSGNHIPGDDSSYINNNNNNNLSILADDQNTRGLLIDDKLMDLSEDALQLLGPSSTSLFSLKSHTYDALFKLKPDHVDRWLSAWLQSLYFTISPAEQQIFEGLLYLTEYWGKLPNTMLQLIQGKLVLKFQSGDGGTANNTTRLQWVKFWDFIPFLPFEEWDEFEPLYLKLGSQYATNPTTVSQFTTSIISLLENWISLKSGSPNNEDEGPDILTQHELWQNVNNVLQSLIHNYVSLLTTGTKPISTESKLSILLSFINILEFMHTIPFSKIKATNLIIPTYLTTQLYFSNCPVLINSICNHITHCKKYYTIYGTKLHSLVSTSTSTSTSRSRSTTPRNSSVSPDGIFDVNESITRQQLTTLKAIHNASVMDFCNVIWRDRSFDKREIDKGFFMPLDFVSKLVKQTYNHPEMSISRRGSQSQSQSQSRGSFNGVDNTTRTGGLGDQGEDVGEDDDDDDDLNHRLKKTFNLFHAPAFASLITSIIRNLEDSNPNNELRLVGPLDPVQFNRLTKSKSNSNSNSHLEKDLKSTLSRNGEKWIGGGVG
ncbi:unnamed protein product [Ambrosiozyma monospora]|uniref:Unnamed protein product n=1 Tax=Ambrosiozyma monospora TaxID=43982 RepID=A0A9W6YX22_AMBMO|nr:unnamed protein product [Ambrosiozyma monospora]